jgi:hypothetical protein
VDATLGVPNLRDTDAFSSARSRETAPRRASSRREPASSRERLRCGQTELSVVMIVSNEFHIHSGPSLSAPPATSWRLGVDCPMITGARGVCTVLRCGSYIFMDMDADYGCNLDHDGAPTKPPSRASSSGRR